MIPCDICALLWLYLEIHPIWAEGDFELWQCDNPGAELLLRQSKTRRRIEGEGKKQQLKVSICSASLWYRNRPARSQYTGLRKKREVCYTFERCSFCRLPRSKFSRINRAEVWQRCRMSGIMRARVSLEPILWIKLNFKSFGNLATVMKKVLSGMS